MTEEEFKVIGHSLGVRVDKYNGDKSLPKNYYRNYYQADKGHYNFYKLLSLVNQGLMSNREQFGMNVFHVTDYGKNCFEYEFKIRNSNQLKN